MLERGPIEPEDPHPVVQGPGAINKWSGESSSQAASLGYLSGRREGGVNPSAHVPGGFGLSGFSGQSMPDREMLGGANMWFQLRRDSSSVMGTTSVDTEPLVHASFSRSAS